MLRRLGMDPDRSSTTGTRSAVAAASTQTLLDRIAAQLERMSGVTDGGAKPAFLATRLATEVHAHGEAGLIALLERAERGDSSADLSLRGLFTVNYSRFWREPEHWPILAEHLRLRFKARAPVRMWSAACARGEEAWTMALVAAELATELAHLEPRWTILGSDIDTVSLDAARAGRYANEDLGSLPDRLREQLILAGRPNAPRREVPAALRQHVEYKYLDLARADWQPPQEAPFDAIFLSNVLIYFERATQERILKNVAGCLRPDGIVFTSRVEGNLGLATRQLKAAGNCTYITARTARRV